jgi:hypothetical protein
VTTTLGWLSAKREDREAIKQKVEKLRGQYKDAEELEKLIRLVTMELNEL